MKKFLIVLAAIILALILIIIIFSDNESKYIKEVNLKEVISKINKKDTFILYIKKDNCEYCKEFNPNFISALKDSKLTAYSINLSDLSEEETKAFDKTFTVNGTPTVLFFDEGSESMRKIEGTLSKDKIIKQFKNVGFIK